MTVQLHQISYINIKLMHKFQLKIHQIHYTYLSYHLWKEKKANNSKHSLVEIYARYIQYTVTKRSEI